jgi:hypothetical protein
MPQRRNRKLKGCSPEALASGLPGELRSFDRWYYNSGDGTGHGLKDYLAAVSVHVAQHHPSVLQIDPVPVMGAAGLSVADWFRHMLTATPTKP